MQGQITVELSLTRDGKLIDAKLASSGGRRLLNDAALKVVKAAAPYPTFLKTDPSDRGKFLIPITFSLN